MCLRSNTFSVSLVRLILLLIPTGYEMKVSRKTTLCLYLGLLDVLNHCCPHSGQSDPNTCRAEWSPPACLLLNLSRLRTPALDIRVCEEHVQSNNIN
ncbi:hypothetical protein PoB_006608500 [Plakobranchus ocellatus]|uniref:Secreted protein n=1 Tax=Plakobranchus ocellatus TaxID=259542 RepID=A0AAV4D606_9GAST|nr:hypothetical protein PoB_006608500 [Plakobranchus ocellatus]